MILSKIHRYNRIAFHVQDGYIVLNDERESDSNGAPIPDELRVSYVTPDDMEARAKAMVKDVARLRVQGDRETARVMLKMLHELSDCIDEARRQGNGFWSPKAAAERSEAGRRVWAPPLGVALPAAVN